MPFSLADYGHGYLEPVTDPNGKHATFAAALESALEYLAEQYEEHQMDLDSLEGCCHDISEVPPGGKRADYVEPEKSEGPKLFVE